MRCLGTIEENLDIRGRIITGKEKEKGQKSPDDELWRRLIPYIDDFHMLIRKRFT